MNSAQLENHGRIIWFTNFTALFKPTSTILGLPLDLQILRGRRSPPRENLEVVNEVVLTCRRRRWAWSFSPPWGRLQQNNNSLQQPASHQRGVPFNMGTLSEIRRAKIIRVVLEKSAGPKRPSKKSPASSWDTEAGTLNRDPEKSHDSPGYDTPVRLTRQGIIPLGD